MECFFKNSMVQLYNGDCVKIMNELIKDGVKVDKIITSPPYNIIRSSAPDLVYDLYRDGMSNDDYVNWTVDIFNCYDKILNSNGCIAYNMSYGMENTEAMNLTIAEILKRTDFTLADILVWKKKGAIPNNTSCNKMTRICEFVYIFCRRSEFYTFTCNKKMLKNREDNQQAYFENVFNFFEASNNDGSTVLNKATFSTEYVYNIIDRYVRDDDIVLDNFSGTGTTLYACSMRGIKSIGIELSTDQCKYSAERIGQYRPASLF